MRRTLFAVLTAVLVAMAAAAANADPLYIGGYAKNFSTVLDAPSYESAVEGPDLSLMGQVSNRLRLNSRLEFSDWLSVNASYGIAGRVQDQLLFAQDLFAVGPDPFAYRFDDFDRRLYPDDLLDARSVGIYHNLDRLSAELSLPVMDLYLGRQAIAWGSARIINPTDILAPYAYTELDTEDRVGIDAVRARIPIGFMGEIDLGYVFGEDFAFDRSAVFARTRYYLCQTDVAVLALGFQENLLVGLDLARSLGGAGVWFEGGYTFVDALADDGDGAGDDYLRLSVGADYSFGEVYGSVEYHYNQAGASDAGDYSELFETTAYQEGNVYLLGKHYLNAGAMWQITPLVNGGGELLFNPADPSILVGPNLEYNIAENIYFGAGAFIGFGERPEVLDNNPPRELVTLRSEFGFYPDLYYLSFRIYY